MELRHLEHFLAVAEEGSFTRAAARSHLVQSALSVSVRALERDLGARLFERTTHRVQLTAEGAALLPQARYTLAAAAAARDAVIAVRGGLRGTVRIGIMRSTSIIDVAGILSEFHRARPEVRLEPHAPAGGSSELVAGVADGQWDLAFAALPGGYPPTVSARVIASEPMGLACPPGHRLAARRRVELPELDGERFVEFPAGWGTRESVDRSFLAAGLSREIVVEVADIPNVLDLVRAGFGLAFVAPSTVTGRLDVPLCAVRSGPAFTVAVLTPARRVQSAAARAMTELLVERYPTWPVPRRA